MKKIMSGLITAVLMAVGLMAFSGAAANAAGCGYTGTCKIGTSTHVYTPATVKVHTSARICVKVTANNSNATPKGQVTINVRRSTGGYAFADSSNYSGGKVCFHTTTLNKRGKYIVDAIFDRKPGSKFKDSDNRATFNVTRRG